MSDQVKVKLPEEVVNYLQALDYELGGLQVLHTHALDAGLGKEKTREIRELYLEKYAQFQVAKMELALDYGHMAPGKSWWVDYTEGVLYFGT